MSPERDASAAGPTISLERVEAWRDWRYRRTPERQAHTEEQARAFVEEVGFAFLFGEKGVAIPTLWGAVTGSRRPVPREHNDADLGRVWTWKDTLPTRKALYYGKLLRNKPTLVALDLLPVFYALSPNYGDPMDYLDQYDAGLLSIEARNVYEALIKGGAMATSLLRKEAGLAGGGAVARRFDNALTELQTELKIVKVGISDASRWGYAYVYDLFSRQFPDVSEQARAIPTDVARETLLLRYLENVLVAQEAAASRLFRWGQWEWDRAVERLAARGAIVQGIRVSGLRGATLGYAVGLAESLDE